MNEKEKKRHLGNCLVFLKKAKYEMGVREFDVLKETMAGLESWLKILNKPEEEETAVETDHVDF